jgi:hypothetical protein
MRFTLIGMMILFGTSACSTTPQFTYIPSRTQSELDPQGQGRNHGPMDCEPGTSPYYIYDENLKIRFFLECVRSTNE